MKTNICLLLFFFVIFSVGATKITEPDGLATPHSTSATVKVQQPTLDESPEVRWGSHLFDRAGLEYLERAPWDLSQLPSQVASIGLNSERLVFAHKAAAFSSFRDQFERAMQNNPVSSKAITDWQASYHGGMTVHTRIFKVNDLGIGVAFMQPHVIFVDLGPADEAVGNKNRLVQMNL